MSETEKHIGKLVKVADQDGKNVSQVISELLTEYGVKMESWHDDELECFKEELYESHVIHGDIIYEVKRIPLESYEDISYAATDKDGNIDFVVEYYNGGCSFSEAIEEALDGMEK